MPRPSFYLASVTRILLTLICFGFCLSQVHAAPSGKLIGIISVDWEGRVLEQDDLKAMRSFRQDYPSIGLLQFLNAAYYTKPNANADHITQSIRSVLSPLDEEGLHIHSWRSLLETAGVPFRRSPNWSYPGEISMNSCYLLDCGHNVPISAYTETELRRMIRTSQMILSHHGFGPAQSFRAGGWMAKPHVISALAKEGFQFDSSATDPNLLKGRRWSDRLYRWLDELWADISTTSQPFLIGQRHASLIELPDNGILADYITAEEMFAVFKENVALWEKDKSKTLYVSIGFHQETAAQYLHEIRGAIDLIEAYSQENQLPFEWASYPLKSSSFEAFRARNHAD